LSAITNMFLINSKFKHHARAGECGAEGDLRNWQAKKEGMKSMTKVLPLLFSLVFFINLAPCYPEALKLWDEYGVPVTIAPEHQLGAVATEDGYGGALIVWWDWRNDPGFGDIYGQRINSCGTTLWEENGILLATALNIYGEPTSQGAPSIASDGAGGAVFVWEDNRNFDGEIFAQRVSGMGDKMWEPDGVRISESLWPGNGKFNPQIASDGTGGAIITWWELRDGFNASVWAQRVKADGTVAWVVNGVPVAYGGDIVYAGYPKILSDGMGGAFIAWQDEREINGYGFRVYVQRLDSNGNPQWAVNGVKVSPPIGQRDISMRGHSMISDGSGGTIIVWVDRRSSPENDSNIYVQRLNGSGEIQWQVDGVPVCTRQGDQYSPALATDGTGGAIIVWEDGPASPPGSGQVWILAQRVNGVGEPLWKTDGMLLHTFYGMDPEIISDGTGGAIIVWDSIKIISPDLHEPNILAQHVNADGLALWDTNGFDVFHQTGGHYGLGAEMVTDAVGGAIIYWQDYRYLDEVWDIFAQRINDMRPQNCDCSSWSEVISKYNTYVSGQAEWNDVIECYNQYVSP
jgi:hypothetical protein